MRNYPTNNIIHKPIDEIRSNDLADMIDYKISNNKGYLYIFVIIDNFLKYLWTITLKNKKSKTITDELSNILTTSERSPLKLESDRGAEFYISILQNFLKAKNIQHFSRFTDKGTSIVERVIRAIGNLLKKRVFLKGNADWVSELPSLTKKYNNTIHHSIKMTPSRASKKSIQKVKFNNLRENKEIHEIHKSKFKPGQLVRTPDFKNVFSKGDSRNYSSKLYTITEIIHDTIRSYRLNYLPER